MPATDSSPVIPFLSKAKLGGGGLLLGLLIGGGLAGWQTLQGGQALQAAEEDCSKRQGELDSAIALANGRAKVLRARVQVARAQGQLTRQNFGDAQAALAKAKAALAEVEPKKAGVTPDNLSLAQKSVDAVNLEAGGDALAQTASLVSAASAIDKLIGD